MWPKRPARITIQGSWQNWGRRRTAQQLEDAEMVMMFMTSKSTSLSLQVPSYRASRHCDRVQKVWFAISAQKLRQIVPQSWGTRPRKAHIHLQARTRDTFLQFHAVNYKVIVPVFQQQHGLQWHCDILKALITWLWTCSVCSKTQRNVQWLTAEKT